MKYTKKPVFYFFMLSSGSHFLDFIIGPKIGQGAFGEIYSSVDSKTGILWAIKTENSDCKRKTLEFEYQVLLQVQSSPHFPRLGVYGKCSTFSFYSMELLGPSLSHIIKQIPTHRLSFSSAIRAIYHTLKGIEAFHVFGLVHRDIKPGNILTREGTENPLCIVDFGLSHIYIDPNTGKILPPRKRIGFRGTKVYASEAAHMLHDLGRKDDIISWFYLSMELLTGYLPWRGKQERSAVLLEKQKYDVQKEIGGILPEMVQIWDYIKTLSFADTPNYSFIYKQLESAMQRNHVSMDSAYDWADFLHAHRRNVAQSLESLQVKKTVKAVKSFENFGIESPLLCAGITANAPFSHISEDTGYCCC